MAEKFDMKSGIINAIKTALKNDKFIDAFLGALLGEAGAKRWLELFLKQAAREETLNEVVAVHRLYKGELNELHGLVAPFNKVDAQFLLGKIGNGSLNKLMKIREESKVFQKEVLRRTLKKPGMKIAFVKVVVAFATPGYVLDDIIAMPETVKLVKCLIETAIEVKRERNGNRGEIDESLEEAFDPNAPKVSLFVGRFQPFTRGHVKCLDKLKTEFGVPVVICAILVNKPDKEHPFCGDLQKKMYERIKTGLNDEFNDLLAENGVIYVDKAYIGDLVAKVKEELGYQAIGWGCGTDRYEIITPRKRPPKEGQSPFVRTGYLPQTEKYIEQQNMLDPEERDIDTDPKNGFKLHHIQRDILGNGDDPVSKISGTKVREAIKEGDMEAFKSMMPKCLYPMFNKFKEALRAIEGPVGEPSYQTTGALAEDKTYEEYKKRVDEAITRLVTGKGKK